MMQKAQWKLNPFCSSLHNVELLCVYDEDSVESLFLLLLLLYFFFFFFFLILMYQSETVNTNVSSVLATGHPVN